MAETQQTPKQDNRIVILRALKNLEDVPTGEPPHKLMEKDFVPLPEQPVPMEEEPERVDFPVRLAVAMQFEIINHMVKGFETMASGIEGFEVNLSEPIDVNVHELAMKNIIEYATYHLEHPLYTNIDKIYCEISKTIPRHDQIVPWDREFLDRVYIKKYPGEEPPKRGEDELAYFMFGSHLLGYKDGVRLAALYIAEVMKDKSAQEIRERWNIPDDLTESEKALLMKENAWCEYAQSSEPKTEKQEDPVQEQKDPQ